MRVGEGVWQDRTSGGRGVAGYSEYVMKGDKQFTKMQGGGQARGGHRLQSLWVCLDAGPVVDG